MKRRIEYDWRLRELMSARGMNNISDLIPELADRGIELSASQIYRLLGTKPERINITIIGAILDVLDCSFEELCPVSVIAMPTRDVVNRPRANVDDAIGALRPRRARIYRPE